MNRKPTSDSDRLDEAFDAFRRMAVPDFPAIESLLSQLNATSDGAVRPSATFPSNFRRFCMRPLFRYAVAASALVAVLVASFSAVATKPALADVVKAAEKHRLARYKVKQTTEDKSNGLTGSGESVAYADLAAPRFRMESGGLTLNGTVRTSHTFVQDGRKGVALGVLTETVIEGKAEDPSLPDFIKANLADGRFPRKEATLMPAGTEWNPAIGSPGKTILENLRELEKHEGVRAVKDRRDGKELLKYRLEDGNATTVLWVDPATTLPVRLEHEIIDPTPAIARNRWVYTDFEWDPAPKGAKDLDELFNTAPPEGYKITDLTRPKAKD